MFRAHTFQHRPHLPFAKVQNARKLRILKPGLKRRVSEFEEIINPSTPDTLFKITDSRSTFVRLWNHANIFGVDNALAGPDGLLSPTGVRFQYGRKRKDPYSTYVENALCMDTIKDHQQKWFIDRLINYVAWGGLYMLGREDDSPLQPYMWEIPKGITIPSSLRLAASRKKSDPSWESNLTFGPAFPMSLECLNQNLEQFMLDYGRATPLRHWFTPEREFCKLFPDQIDFIRKEEEYLKSEGLYDDELLRREIRGL